MDASQIQNLLEGGESETVEFKRSVPPARMLARTIAAFANTRGGTLLLGVDESPKARAAGVDSDLAEYRLMQATQMLVPLPEVRTSRVIVGGVDVVVAEIVASSQLTLAPDGLFARFGELERPFTPSEVTEKVSTSESNSQEAVSLAQALARLTKQLEDQGPLLASLTKANHWSRKGLWVLLGAAAGAIAKTLLTAFV